MTSFDSILNWLDDVVWGLPTIILILATGLLLTVRLRGMQFTKLGRALKSIFRKNEGSEHGEVSSFGALCTALSATIGTGNIVGVATAIAAGGPGALFWMWVAALVGIATKYAECMLALKYRERKEDGHILGGPFYTIEKGMKEITGFSWKWLAVLFALFGVLTGVLGIGTITQINGITSAVNNALDPENTHVAFAFGTPTEEYLASKPEYAEQLEKQLVLKAAYAEKTDAKIEKLNVKLSGLKEDFNTKIAASYLAESKKTEKLVKKIADVEAAIADLAAGKENSANYGKTMVVSGKAFTNDMFAASDSHPMSWVVVIAGAIVTLFVALVVIGGLQRISKVAEFIVPFMAVVYVFLGLSVLIMNATLLPEAFAVIFKCAFGIKAVAGGAAGFAITQAMQKGVARGIFSNEAGLGSAAIAASSANVKEPVTQGLVSMTGTFIDTIIVCTMTGLAIVIAFFTGKNGMDVQVADGAINGLRGVAITSTAFTDVLGGDGQSVKFLLMICLVFFAFTTILGWDYYSERCLEYLTNGKMGIVKAYRVVYILAVFIGPYLTVSQVWTIADITNGLMAIPNCISLIILSGVAAKMTRDYFDKYPTLESEDF